MKSACTALLFMISLSLFGTHLSIENVRPVFKPQFNEKPSVILDIKWDNAWYNSKNHDAVWLFFKFTSAYEHPKIAPTGHVVLNNRVAGSPDPIFRVSPDSLGVFFELDQNYRGEINCKIQVYLDDKNQEIDFRKLTRFNAYGIEMVYIPEGSFTVGSPDTTSTKYASFYKSDPSGNRSGLYKIDSESSIQIGPEKDKLYYWSESEEYNGDQKGTVNPDFPKGYAPFYVMKYELTQGMYADFLNQIAQNWTYERSPIGGRNYYNSRGGIKMVDGQYVAESYHRPMNFVSWTDGIAFTDWACLRPITELEYEKAARGPGQPSDKEFVWGTNNYDRLERYVNEEHELVLSNGFEESQLNDGNRDIFGASYYWVMDLSGSVWEKVITIGNEKGRSFKGSHGDGILDYGFADNKDWPLLDEYGGGFGYRGGGYYNRTSYSDFNPHSPIGYRYYGAWSGGPRSIAYGYRAGRTAE